MNEAIRYEARLFSEKFSTTSVASCEFEIFETEDILSRGRWEVIFTFFKKIY